MNEITLSYYGINQEDTIESGEIRRINIEPVVPYSSQKLQYPVNMYYQLFIQEGQERIVVIDWQKMNRSCDDYYIVLDTSWWIPNMYYIDIKYEYNGETRKILDPIKLKVVNKIINPNR
jgi:hypothetical protein